MTTLVDATRRNEVGTLNYEWAISNDQKVCHIYERYQDSVAVMIHLKSFAANYAALIFRSGDPDPTDHLRKTEPRGERCAGQGKPHFYGAIWGL